MELFSLNIHYWEKCLCMQKQNLEHNLKRHLISLFQVKILNTVPQLLWRICNCIPHPEKQRLLEVPRPGCAEGLRSVLPHHPLPQTMPWLTASLSLLPPCTCCLTSWGSQHCAFSFLLNLMSRALLLKQILSFLIFPELITTDIVTTASRAKWTCIRLR